MFTSYYPPKFTRTLKATVENNAELVELFEDIRVGLWTDVEIQLEASLIHSFEERKKKFIRDSITLESNYTSGWFKLQIKLPA